MTKTVRVLTLDPGESTGWCLGTISSEPQKTLVPIVGGTCARNHIEVAELIESIHPDILVFERFNLYPGMAKSLSWNSFYPCEVIGVIRYTCDRLKIRYVEQAPGVKKFSGYTTKATTPGWSTLKETGEQRVTEHTWDALLHLHYFFRNMPKGII